MENVLPKKSSVPLDTSKPFVKNYFDLDKEIKSYILNRIPELANYEKVSVIKLYSSKDGNTHKYRVNWHSSDGKIPLSQFIEIDANKEEIKGLKIIN